MTPQESLPFSAAWRLTRNAVAGLIVGGVLALGLGWDAGAWLVVAALGFTSATSILVAAIAYRRTMRRQWPKVAPLSDDEWDDE